MGVQGRKCVLALFLVSHLWCLSSFAKTEFRPEHEVRVKRIERIVGNIAKALVKASSIQQIRDIAMEIGGKELYELANQAALHQLNDLNLAKVRWTAEAEFSKFYKLLQDLEASTNKKKMIIFEPIFWKDFALGQDLFSGVFQTNAELSHWANKFAFYAQSKLSVTVYPMGAQEAFDAEKAANRHLVSNAVCYFLGSSLLIYLVKKAVHWFISNARALWHQEIQQTENKKKRHRRRPHIPPWPPLELEIPTPSLIAFIGENSAALSPSIITKPKNIDVQKKQTDESRSLSLLNRLKSGLKRVAILKNQSEDTKTEEKNLIDHINELRDLLIFELSTSSKNIRLRALTLFKKLEESDHVTITVQLRAASCYDDVQKQLSY